MPTVLAFTLAQAAPIPESSLFTRYIFENPWPLGLLLAFVGVILLWNGLREGLPTRQRLGFAFGFSGLLVLAAGWFIVTAGEHASRVTRQLVDAVVDHDSQAAIALFSPDAVMTIGSPRNPGFALDYISDRLDTLAARYRIDSNRITGMKLATESGRAGLTHLACMTTVDGVPYPNISRWQLTVAKEGDGTWKITRLTCVEINGNTPSSSELW